MVLDMDLVKSIVNSDTFVIFAMHFNNRYEFGGGEVDSPRGPINLGKSFEIT